MEYWGITTVGIITIYIFITIAILWRSSLSLSLTIFQIPSSLKLLNGFRLIFAWLFLGYHAQNFNVLIFDPWKNIKNTKNRVYGSDRSFLAYISKTARFKYNSDIGVTVFSMMRYICGQILVKFIDPCWNCCPLWTFFAVYILFLSKIFSPVTTVQMIVGMMI